MRRNHKNFTGYGIGLVVCAVLSAFVPQARADTMTMCITNVNPTSNPDCDKGSKLLGTGSILLTSNGTTITASTHGSATISGDSTESSPFSDLVFLGSVGMFTGLDIDGSVEESATNALDVSYDGSSKGLRDLWIEFNFNDVSGGTPFSLSAGGTQDKVKDNFWGCFTGSGLWCTTSGTLIGKESTPFPSTMTTSMLGAPSNPFGLGIQLEVIPLGSGSTSGDLSIVPTKIPEPTGIILLGSSILVLFGVAKRKFPA